MPLLLLTILGFLAAAAGLTYALLRKRFGTAKIIAIGSAIWSGIYFLILLAVSFASGEKLLAFNEEKAFCGFYLDCHLHASVVKAEKTKTLGVAPEQINAAGNYYVVTVKIKSDARRVTLQPYNLEAEIIDETGRKFQRSLEAEKALELPEGKTVPFEQAVGPRGGFYTKELVFDLPADVKNPHLLVTEGWWLERIIELFIVGDEDSFLHKKTFHNLGA